jgi:hypothetical protein
VSDNWQKAYSELLEYTAKNPQIEIGMNVIAIPGDVRPGFYRLFDTVRVAFLKEKYQTLLDEAASLSSNYARAAQEATRSLGLAKIKVPASLNRFLNDPVNGLIRSLPDPLFNLLRGKIDIDAFENEAMASIESSFRQLFQSGYEKWVVLSLVNLLAPDRVLEVPKEDLQDQVHEIEWDQKDGIFELSVPDVKEMELLSLGERLDAEDVFILSDLIVRSAKLNRYVSITADLADAILTAKEVSDKREWHRLREVGKPYTRIDDWPDLVIYIDDQPEDIALVADFGRFCRPDIIVECMEQVDWYQKGGLDRVRQNYDFLKPRLGSYVVSRVPVPEEAWRELTPEPAAGEPAPEQKTPPKEQPLDIHILTVGYDHSRLAPIIDALLSGKEAAGETEGQ